MKLFYLENKVKTPDNDYKYYRNGSDCGGESYDGTSDLRYARFFLDEETARAYLSDANDWWTKFDFQVKSIEFDEWVKIVQQDNPRLKTFLIDRWQ